MYFSRPLKLPFPLSLGMTHGTCSARAGILFFCSQVRHLSVRRWTKTPFDAGMRLSWETDFQIDWSELLCRAIKFFCIYKSTSRWIARRACGGKKQKAAAAAGNFVVNWRRLGQVACH
jgi:hypothetical protein